MYILYNHSFYQHLLTESKYLTLVLITLIIIPFHIFGIVAVTKRSFTLTLTYTIITFVLLCLELRSSFVLDVPGHHHHHYLIMWLIQFVLFDLVILFNIRLYREKIRKI